MLNPNAKQKDLLRKSRNLLIWYILIILYFTINYGISLLKNGLLIILYTIAMLAPIYWAIGNATSEKNAIIRARAEKLFTILGKITFWVFAPMMALLIIVYLFSLIFK